jgi:hypothetical protein
MADTFSTPFNPAGSNSSGLLEDWKNTLKYKSPFNYTQPSGAAGGLMETPYVAPKVDPINPGVDTDIEKYLKLQSALLPLRLQEQQAQAKFGAEATRQQLADLFPYLSAASSEATARNLAASTQFLLTKEQTPSAQALRNQVAQGQMTSAAGAEADRDRATAAQAMAAKNFAKGYAGAMVNTTA